MARMDRESLQTPQPSERRDRRRDRFAGPSPAMAGMLGKSSAMRHVFAVINRVAKASTTLLIQGETGTGKELVAKAIHALSDRPDQPFVPIDCGAIPDNLLEAELFGHEKGAYTGAHIERRGLFALADGGTAFLDEISELRLSLQVKLLRFLQEREVVRIGARDRVKVDVRVIAATNRDLAAETEAGRFRSDLYYRIAVITLKLPPLRERGEDTILLANAFLEQDCRQHRRRLRFSDEALAAVRRYPWPGNVRELKSAVERVALLAEGDRITPGDLGIEPTPAVRPLSWKESRDQAAREILVNALVRTTGNVSRAARALAICRPTLHELLQRYGVSAKDFRPASRPTGVRSQRP
jgi:two-component system, NtrC family, response regulator